MGTSRYNKLDAEILLIVWASIDLVQMLLLSEHNSSHRPEESQWLLNYGTLQSAYILIHDLIWCQAEENKG